MVFLSAIRMLGYRFVDNGIKFRLVMADAWDLGVLCLLHLSQRHLGRLFHGTTAYFDRKLDEDGCLWRRRVKDTSLPFSWYSCLL